MGDGRPDTRFGLALATTAQSARSTSTSTWPVLGALRLEGQSATVEAVGLAVLAAIAANAGTTLPRGSRRAGILLAAAGGATAAAAACGYAAFTLLPVG